MTPLDAALDYAARFGPVFPVRFNPDPLAKKYPLTEHGKNDASRDAAVIREWWRRWSNAVPSIVTGEASGHIALDIDKRPHGDGFDSLDENGIAFHPEAPTAHTPQGGCAPPFRWPGHFVKTTASKLGPHVDIRDGGSLILPPGPGRFVRRLAVNPDQIRSLDLPGKPPKASDSRAKSFSGHTVEAEAIPVQTMQKIVRDAIESFIDERVLRKRSQQQRPRSVNFCKWAARLGSLV
jgi:hypothetical protein